MIGGSLFQVLTCASDRESGGQGKRLKNEQNLEIPVLMAEQSTDLTPAGAETSALKSSSRLSPGRDIVLGSYGCGSWCFVLSKMFICLCIGQFFLYPLVIGRGSAQRHNLTSHFPASGLK